MNCVVPENIHTSSIEGIGSSWGVGGSQKPKNLSNCMKLDWNFQRGGGGGEGGGGGRRWITFGTTHSAFVSYEEFSLISIILHKILSQFKRRTIHVPNFKIPIWVDQNDTSLKVDSNVEPY